MISTDVYDRVYHLCGNFTSPSGPCYRAAQDAMNTAGDFDVSTAQSSAHNPPAHDCGLTAIVSHLPLLPSCGLSRSITSQHCSSPHIRHASTAVPVADTGAATDAGLIPALCALSLPAGV
jgi:hypothetical protein